MCLNVTFSLANEQNKEFFFFLKPKQNPYKKQKNPRYVVNCLANCIVRPLDSRGQYHQRLWHSPLVLQVNHMMIQILKMCKGDHSY